MLEACQVKTKLKDLVAVESEKAPKEEADDSRIKIRQVSSFSLAVKKTINNREYRETTSTKKSNESEMNNPINCIAFN